MHPPNTRQLALSLTPLVSCVTAGVAGADVRVPALFGDGMVLQRDTELRVWGRADPEEQVTVRIADRTGTTITGAGGQWELRLDPLPAGGPHRMVVEGRNTLTFEDVLLGEVWLGSGQSNMVMTVRHCSGFADAARAAELPAMRMFREESGPSPEPGWQGKGEWVACTPESVGDFSGVLFYFGRALHAELGVPVGLIDSSMSASPIQSWIRDDAQRACPELSDFVAAEEAAYSQFDLKGVRQQYRRELRDWKKSVELAIAAGREPPGKPANPAELYRRQGGIGGLFNGKIAPLIPYGLRGVIWCQGENNVCQAPLYKHQLPLLVRDWRACWDRDDLPFVWVQLPNFGDFRDDADLPAVREAMRRSLRLPGTGMVVTIDIGERRNVHPKNKLDVGERLAAWALGELYGRDVAGSGPLLASHEVRGAEVQLRFDHVDGGLVARGGPLRGFEIAGSGGSWHPARARIEAGQILVGSPQVERPVAVRYAWAADPDCNLFNGAGLPASPFTTADLPTCSISDGRIPAQRWTLILRSPGD